MKLLLSAFAMLAIALLFGRHLGEDVNGVSVSPTSASAVKWCGLGAVISRRLTN
jgi:hypothetical protein